MTRDPQHLRQAREAALQMLYGWEMGGEALPDAIEGVQALQLRPPGAERDELAVELAKGTARSLDRIDPLIAEVAHNWRIERLAVIDRLVLRLAVHELLDRPTVPPAVVINEALELARTFSAPEAVRFVNGVLDGIRRKLHEDRESGIGNRESSVGHREPGTGNREPEAAQPEIDKQEPETGASKPDSGSGVQGPVRK